MVKQYYGNELYHHGIKGQKWGVRRYQNEDGTLTEEGKERYSISKKDVKRSLKIGAGVATAGAAYNVAKAAKTFKEGVESYVARAAEDLYYDALDADIARRFFEKNGVKAIEDYDLNRLTHNKAYLETMFNKLPWLKNKTVGSLFGDGATYRYNYNELTPKNLVDLADKYISYGQNASLMDFTTNTSIISSGNQEALRSISFMKDIVLEDLGPGLIKSGVLGLGAGLLGLGISAAINDSRSNNVNKQLETK